MKQHLFTPPAIPPSLLVVVVVVDVGAGRPPECHSAVSGVPCRSCVPECCVGGAAGWRAVCRSAVPRPPCHTCHTVPCRATPAVPHSAGVPCRARRATRATRPCRAVPAAPEASKYDRPVALPRPRSAPEALTELQVASKPPSSSECFPTPLHPVIIYVGHNTVRLRLLKEKCLHHFGLSCKSNGTAAPPRPRL